MSVAHGFREKTLERMNQWYAGRRSRRFTKEKGKKQEEREKGKINDDRRSCPLESEEVPDLLQWKWSPTDQLKPR